MVINLVPIYFDILQLGHTAKSSSIRFKAVDLEIGSSLIFYKIVSD